MLLRLMTYHIPRDCHAALTCRARAFSAASWELAEIHAETSELRQRHLQPGPEEKQKSFRTCSSHPDREAFEDTKLITEQTLTQEHGACGAGRRDPAFPHERRGQGPLTHQPPLSGLTQLLC